MRAFHAAGAAVSIANIAAQVHAICAQFGAIDFLPYGAATFLDCGLGPDRRLGPKGFEGKGD